MCIYSVIFVFIVPIWHIVGLLVLKFIVFVGEQEERG